MWSSVFHLKKKEWERALVLLQEGDNSQMAKVYEALAWHDATCVNRAAFVIHKVLEQMSPAKLIRLEEQFRQMTSLDYFVDWNNFSLQTLKSQLAQREEYESVVCLGTFHPNGYYREKCIRELKANQIGFPFLLLRCNDWAIPVSQLAYEVILEQIEKVPFSTLIFSIPFLEKVKRGQRRSHEQLLEIEKEITKRIGCELKKRNLFHQIDEWEKCDFYTRKYLYHLLLRQHMLDREQVKRLLSLERNGSCQSAIICDVLQYDSCSLEELDEYMKHKSSIVRRRALEYKYKIVKNNWQGLERMLLDKSKGIRELAVYIIHKHSEYSAVGFYLQHLNTDYKKIAVLGLGEQGNQQEGKILFELLKETDEGIVRNALYSIGMIYGSSEEEIFWEFLLRDSDILSCAAYKVIRKNDIHYGAERIYQAFLLSENPCTQRHLLCLLCMESSWSRLPYLLMLYQYPDEHLQKKIREAICNRSTYGLISKEYACHIREIMAQPIYKIPQEVCKGIEFDLKYVTKA